MKNKTGPEAPCQSSSTYNPIKFGK